MDKAAESASSAEPSQPSPDEYDYIGPYPTQSPDDPPTYVQHDADIREHVQKLVQDARRDGPELPVLCYPKELTLDPLAVVDRQTGFLSEVIVRQRDIVDAYFKAIKSRTDEVVALFIDSGLVTTETTNDQGRTPLLAAVEAGNVRTVQQLMDYGADVNAFGVTANFSPPRYGKPQPQIRRTPLMVAAEKGNLTLVKLLIETFNADDAAIAPDGQLALRLAAANGHRDVVQYLPARRGGGWRRWKTKHQTAMRRAKKAGEKIYMFLKVLLWYIPKFFVWDVPKHLVVKPLVRGARWLGEHRKELPTIIAEWMKRTAKRVVECGKRVGRWAKTVPRKTWELIKKIPDATKELCKAIWGFIKEVPKAAWTALLWIWDGIKKIGISIGSVVGRLLSFIHTVISAVVSFFRNITLKDIWDGFCIFLRAVFIDAPVKIWEFLCKFGDVSYKVMVSLFGCLGECAWWILRALLELVVYVPKKVGVILGALAQSVGGGCQEVLIWFNPKRA